MGWQGQLRKRTELERIAQSLHEHWQNIRVYCWRDNDMYWVETPAHPTTLQRMHRKTLRPEPLP